MAPASEQIVTRRDRAILDALQIRAWTTKELLSVMPVEANQNLEQRTTARDSALIRLRVKQRIQEVDGQWRLA